MTDDTSRLDRRPWPNPDRYFGFGPPTLSRASDPDGLRYIYFLQQGDLVKVGLAKDVASRIKEFRLASPQGLVLRGSVAVPQPLARQVERKIHSALTHAAVGREWFRTSPAEAKRAARPIIRAAFKAHQLFAMDGFWTPLVDIPKPPKAALSCGLPYMDRDDDGYPADAWLDRLRKWKPEFYQAARLVAIDLLALRPDLPCASVKVEEGRTLSGAEALIVQFSTGGWSGNEGFIAAALSHYAVKHLQIRWERGGHYWFEVPTRYIGTIP